MSTPTSAAPGASAAPGTPAHSTAGTGASSAVEQRLAELGLSLPQVAAPVAAYV
ncbi:MAG: LysR family transcriptional regulator, partial [Arthrobacter sp.]|nr:LysR family transcriptional regulator [Arthrobacter sp.]